MHGLLNGINRDSSAVRAEEIHAQMQLLNRKIEELTDRITASLAEAKR